MRLSFFVIIACLFCCCSNKEPKLLVVSDKFGPNTSKDSVARYFSFDSLLLVSNSYPRIEGYYVKKQAREVLSNFSEPSLYDYTGEGESVRLLWLPSFGNPVVIRVNNFNDTVYVNVKEQKEKSYETERPKVLTDTIITLSTKEWKDVLSDLEANKFWDAKIEDSSSGKDGIPWFLETRLNNKYYYIIRWDAGDLSSRDLNLYAKKLIDIGRGIVQMKSRK